MKTKILSTILLSFILLFSANKLVANNIKIVETPSLDQSSGLPAGYWAIKFGLSWENSWKSSNPRNWDAAWIFVKYNIGGEGWHHCILADTTAAEKALGIVNDINDAQAAPAGGDLNMTAFEWQLSPGYSKVPGNPSITDNNWQIAGDSLMPVGYFLHRKKNGFGKIECKGIRLMWNYAQQGIMSDDPVTVMVFAIEMVYVPKGEFSLGTGGSENNCFQTSYGAAADFRVRSEDAIKWKTHVASPVSGWTIADSLGISCNAAQNDYSIPREYPKGYDDFYVMKYEITQEAYVDFLNTLDVSQQGYRVRAPLSGRTTQLNASLINQTSLYHNSGASVFNNGIIMSELKGAGTFSCDLQTGGAGANDMNDGQNIAMNFLSTEDWLAYLAWSGLRPLTEMEFEKAARGTANPVKSEYAWGTDKAYPCAYTALDANMERRGQAGEKPKIPSGQSIVNYNGQIGSGTSTTLNTSKAPLRVGSFANATSDRPTAGASFYGIMELSGNVVERYVHAQRPSAFQKFQGTHGYGALSNDIYAKPPTNLEWPTNYSLGNETATPPISGYGQNTNVTLSTMLTGAAGQGDYIFRGGGYGCDYRASQVSDRTYFGYGAVSTSTSGFPLYNSGGRGGRTASATR